MSYHGLIAEQEKFCNARSICRWSLIRFLRVSILLVKSQCEFSSFYNRAFKSLVIATASAINCYHGIGANGLASITSVSCGTGISLCATTSTGKVIFSNRFSVLKPSKRPLIDTIWVQTPKDATGT